MKTLFFFCCLCFASQTAFAQLGKSAQLEMAFKAAQDAYFSEADLQEVKNKFTTVAQLKNLGPWSEDQRKVIHFSLLRLAQLEENPVEQMRWIQKALDFDFHLKPDGELFPPPLIQTFEKEKSKREVRTLPEPLPLQETLSLAPSEPSPDSQFSKAVGESRSLSMKRPFWKSKWLWIGVGALASAYLIYENQKDQNQDQDSPREEEERRGKSTTYGF